MFHLIRHQRDQGRHDDGEALQQQRWKLEAQALARARRHDADDVSAIHYVLYHFSLVRTKVRKLEDTLQKIVKIVHEKWLLNLLYRGWPESSAGPMHMSGESPAALPSRETFSGFPSPGASLIATIILLN